tara:strand:- start:8962 stop:9741 length:780 start_codon:yes stop_codon:yes gene_type:complete
MARNIGDVFLAIDKSRELEQEYAILEEYRKNREKEAEEATIGQFLGGIIGGTLGFVFGGLAGAAKGFGYGSAGGRVSQTYDDYTLSKEDLKFFEGGKFNRADDLRLKEELLDSAKDTRKAEALGTLGGIAQTYIASSKMPKVSDFWEDMSIAEKIEFTGKELFDKKEDSYAFSDTINVKAKGTDIPFSKQSLPFKSAVKSAAKGVFTPGTAANELARFISSNYGVSNYLRGGTINDLVGQYLMSSILPQSMKLIQDKDN